MTNRDINPVHSVAAFYVGAIAISWTCWMLVVGADHGLLTLPGGLKDSLVIIGGFGPLFSALAMTGQSAGRRGLLSLLRQGLHWRVPIRWYAAALLLPVAVRFAVLGLHILKGGGFPGLTDIDRWLAVPMTFALVLILGGPLGEEVGWRGFSQPRLQNRLGILQSSLIIGVASALWHLPLFLIPATPQSHLPLALFIVRTVALSVISGWIWNRSGRSLLLVLIFHASLNTWPNTLFILEAQGTLGPYISTSILYAAWAILLILLGQLTPRRSALRPRRDTDQAAA
jgi:membrane protease YdiL (CAAX protease family)